MDEEDEDESDESHTPSVAIKAVALHIVPPQDAVRIVDAEIGSGTAWSSPLMQYRTTAPFQEDWKIEVGNWIERARRLGFLPQLRGNVVPQQQQAGVRAAGDPVHQTVTQRLAQAELVHYFVGTGWGFHAYEPAVLEARSSGIPADVDVQLNAPGGAVVDFQVKASGELGLHDNIVDDRIQRGIRKAAAQLPISPTRPALIAVLAQRGWPLTTDIQVVEEFIGSTAGYPDGAVLLHDDERGEFLNWPHVSGIVVLDLRRGIADSDYGCVLLQNPWARIPVDPAWFPHARVLAHANGTFTWLRGHPPYSTFRNGAICFSGSVNDAMRKHHVRAAR